MTFVAAESTMGSTSRVPAPAGGRLQSVDLLRGLDVLLMLFVNDIAGVSGTPSFLRHVSRGADGMTITDVVFPAFLFITGMAIPLAIDRRLQRGERRAAIWRHVLVRALSLIVIGVFMVNGESASSGGLLSPDVWTVLMTVGVALIWLSPAAASAPAHGTQDPASASASASAPRAASSGGGARTIRWLIGGLLLALLIVLYPGPQTDAGGLGALAFRPRWWGILGLIGWAYLAAVTIYLWSPRRPFALLGAAALVYILTMADQAGQTWWLAALHLPSLPLGMVLGVHTAIVLSGIVLTLLFFDHRLEERRVEGRPPWSAVGPALGYAIGLAVAAVLLHQLHGLHTAFWYSKLIGTTPWGLMSSALAAAVWTLLFVAVDLKGWSRWPRLVSIAGEHALTVYLLAPLLYALFAIAGTMVGVDWYGALGRITSIGFLRAIAFATLLVSLCGWLSARGLRLRL